MHSRPSLLAVAAAGAAVQAADTRLLLQRGEELRSALFSHSHHAVLAWKEEAASCLSYAGD